MKSGKATIAVGQRREALAQDPLSADEILTGFYRPVHPQPPRTQAAGAAVPAPVTPIAEHHGPVARPLRDKEGQREKETEMRPGQALSHPGAHAGPVTMNLHGGEAEACPVPAAGLKKPKPSHYKIVCISLYTEDIARLDSLVAELKRRGHTKANKSQLIRAALEQVDLDKVPKAH